MRAAALVPTLLALLVVAAACGGDRPVGDPRWSGRSGPAPPTAIEKIKHVIIIAQENHSFDNYFGTFPGADGIPMKNGKPAVCVPNPETNKCEAPYHNAKKANYGGPHTNVAANTDINGGKMDGFLRMERAGRKVTCKKGDFFDPECSVAADKAAGPDVMGYRDAREIPNYWRYAEEFVLQDRMFASVAAASVPNNVARVSGWLAECGSADPMSCQNTQDIVNLPKRSPPTFAWTDITYLLHRNDVSWAYYVDKGSDGTPPERNPLPYFTTVKQNGQLGNIQDFARFYEAAQKGSLPAVSWIMSGAEKSEHPPASIRDGQAFVTRVINAAMRSPDWESTAIFLTWDEWGGFYDHVPPVKVDRNGYGIRVPGLVISPYAKKGYIDHQTLSSDAYLKFIEDRFLGGQRLDPATDGRPDPRPTVRENAPQLGDITRAFDFSQRPRPPLILPEYPPPGPASTKGR